jgi:hypothetical protein
MPSGEATNTNFIVWFNQTRAQLKPMIYHTWGEHANHYATNAVTNFIVSGLTWQGLEPMICHTPGKHANHYTTDEPMICHTPGKHANHYTTDAVIARQTGTPYVIYGYWKHLILPLYAAQLGQICNFLLLS